jgi:hypothetical protein
VLGIATLSQHLSIVVALQDQRIAGIEHFHHMCSDMPGIRQHAEPVRPIFEHELHRLTRIMGDGKRLYLISPTCQCLVAVDDADVYLAIRLPAARQRAMGKSTDQSYLRAQAKTPPT